LFAGKGSSLIPFGQRNAISYWSLHDNKILRKFRGHQDKVTTISMSPADDSFLTSSLDRTVRLWDVQQAGCVAELKLPTETSGGPIACFDRTGLVFGVGAMMADGQGHYMHLYDARNYGAGAFAEFKVSQEAVAKAIQSQTGVQSEKGLGSLHSFNFNTSGNQILFSGENGDALLLDGYDGKILRAFSQANKSGDGPLACCFTSDDKTLLHAHDDGSIQCWDLLSGAAVQKLSGHQSRVNCIQSNPRYSQLATSCAQTCLWLW
jgi:COMPASS component SWD2